MKIDVAVSDYTTHGHKITVGFECLYHSHAHADRQGVGVVNWEGGDFFACPLRKNTTRTLT